MWWWWTTCPRGHRAALKGGRLYVGDVGNSAFLEQVFSQEHIDAVIHFAAYSLVGESMTIPDRYFRNNCMAGLTLIQTMVAHKVPYLVFSSTAATFGEPDYTPIDEVHPQVPTNPYGGDKLIVERMLRWCDQAYGLKYVPLRYFNVAGASPDGSIGEDHRAGDPPDPSDPLRGPGQAGQSEAVWYRLPHPGRQLHPGLYPCVQT